MSKTHEGYGSFVGRLKDQKRPVPRQRPVVGWLTPTLLNGCSNVGSPYAPVQFHKSEDGKVYIRGAVAGGSDGTVIFILPIGYRPFYTERFLCASDLPGSSPVMIEVDADGQVIWREF